MIGFVKMLPALMPTYTRSSNKPEMYSSEVRVEADIDARSITIVETRPPWREDFGLEWTRFPIARMRYVSKTWLCTLYWRDRNLKFHLYDRVRPTPYIEELLTEIDADPTAIFWG